MSIRVAVLDDYQDVALQMTDWSVLPPDVQVQVFRDHLADQNAVAQQEDKATRAGQWQVSVGEGLHGKGLGVVGLGNLGSQVATVAPTRVLATPKA